MRLGIGTLAGVCGFWAWLGGCTAEVDADPRERPGAGAGKADNLFEHGDIVPTQTLNPSPAFGFIPELDRQAARRCVTAQDTASPHVLGFDARGEVIAGSKVTDFDTGTGIGINIPIKSPLHAIDIGGSFAQHASDNENALYMYYTIEHVFLVADADADGFAVEYELQPDKAELLTAGSHNSFIKQCGTHFVSGVRYGARYELLVKYKFKEAKDTTEAKANLGFDDGLLGTLFDFFQPPPMTMNCRAGTLNCAAPRQGMVAPATRNVLDFFHGTLETASDIEITATWAATGIDAEIARTADIAFTNTVSVREMSEDQGNNAVIASETLDVTSTPMITTKLEKISEIIAASVKNDACRLGGGNNCQGTGRAARPTGVQVTPYAAIVFDDASSQAANEYQNRVDVTIGTYVDAFDVRRSELLNAYIQDIVPADAAIEAGFPAYNVVPPGAPIERPSELEDVLSAADQLHPEVLPAELDAEISRCRDDVATQGFGAPCAFASLVAGFVPAADKEALRAATLEQILALPKIVEADEALRIYYEQPVAAMTVKIGSEVRDLFNANGHCQTIGGSEYRLPTLEEAELLKPLLVAGNISGYSTWVTDPACEANPKHLALLTYRPSSDSFDLTCTDGSAEQRSHVMCVPPNGPAPRN
jgi:hypothetical protein